MCVHEVQAFLLCTPIYVYTTVRSERVENNHNKPFNSKHCDLRFKIQFRPIKPSFSPVNNFESSKTMKWNGHAIKILLMFMVNMSIQRYRSSRLRMNREKIKVFARQLKGR